MKIALFLLISLSFVISRDNPFEKNPIIDDFARTIESGLDEQEIYLPTSAVQIRKITIEYKNMDSSIDTKVIKLNFPLNRTKPLIVYQQKKKIMANMMLLKDGMSNASFKPYKFFKFEINGNKVKIITNKRLIRNFPIPYPQTILMDFKHQDVIIPKKFHLKSVSYFKFVNITSHKGYLRFSIEVDDRYRYKIFTKDYGYLMVIEI
jgi:hypothetical protein